MRLTWLFAATLAAQHTHHNGPMPPQSGGLYQGLGNHTHPIATKSAGAQKLFDQGLILCFGFNHDEAVKQFEKAAALDPEAAMPWWGKAFALGPNYNLPPVPEREQAAAAALAEARKRGANAPDHERDYIEALSARYSADPQKDRRALAIAYKDAMRRLSQKYPDDLDAATIYAESLMNLNPWRLWNKDGTPGDGTLEAVALLEKVLQRDPDHPGANHYYIHAVEASPSPARALPSAHTLERLGLNAGHLVHMPSHIYHRIGDYEATARANEAAVKVDQAYLTGNTKPGLYSMAYYPHNIHFVVVARATQGRYADARRAAGVLAAAVTPGLKEMPFAQMFLGVTYTVPLIFHRWDDALAATKPDADQPMALAAWHYARAVAYAAQRKLSDHRREAAAYRQAAAAIPDDLMPYPAKKEPFVQLGELSLKALLLEATNQPAADAWREAVAVYDQLDYMEPPLWHYPVRQSFGAALLREGRPAEAEAAFRAGLEDAPRDGRLLFGLWKSLAAKGDSRAASLVEAEFHRAWSAAETPLSLDDL